MLQRRKATIILATAILFYSIVPSAVSAQLPAVKNLLFKTLTINDGLSQGMVNCIIQDRYGFMWFATKDGLNRYDGYQFVVYRHDPSNPMSVADNYLEYLFEDSKGRLWVGTTSQGLDLFDRQTETFRHFKKNANDHTDLGSVRSIAESKTGQIWITSEDGVAVITENKTEKNAAPAFSFASVNHKESRLFIAQNGTIWISELNGNLFTISTGKDGKEKVDTIPLNRYCSYGKKDRGNEKYVFAFAEDTINHGLYLFQQNCISRFDEKNDTFRITPFKPLGGVSFSFTSSINDKTIWLVNNSRLLQYDINSTQITFIEDRNATKEELTNNVSCVYTDRTGVVWIGTKGYGLLKSNSRSEKFHHTDSRSIHWMQQTSQGEVLMAIDGAYFDVFDRKRGSFSGTLPDPVVRMDTEYVYGVIEAAIQDDDQTYWICKNTLLRYDATIKKFDRYPQKKAFPVYKDGAGTIWFGSDNSFSRYDKKTKRFTDYRYPVPAQQYPYNFLQAIYQSDDGLFWLGTTSGLLCFEPVTLKWKQYKNHPGDSTSLSFDMIFSLCPDPLQPGRYLWIGTNGGGLNRFDRKTGKVIRYSVKNGLANDVVYGILSDEEGNLWMSTNNGLSKLDKDRLSFSNYDANDGLQSNEFNRNAFCKTQDGTLFFGGVNGFNYFNPAELLNNAVAPNILISSFKITNKAVSFRSNNSSLSKPVYLTDTIVLPYSDNMISFDFVALDFINPGKNLYQYKLVGFDRDWINSGTDHSATYTNLDPGTYTLKIRGSNSDGIWSHEGTSLRLVILPPWYMTLWFRIGIGLLILSALYLLYRYRLAQALKLQAVRNRIASDLHDEIGSNLSNISIFSDVAQIKLQHNATEADRLLKKITEHSRTSMEAMSDIVWMLNSRNDSFENIIVRMRILGAEIFEATGCRLHLLFDEQLNHVNMKMEARKNFFLFYKEAINNVAKHSGCKKVLIEMNVVNNVIKLLIKDDGRGFDPLTAKRGNGLDNLQKRATDLKGDYTIRSKPGEGTEIILQFKPGHFELATSFFLAARKKFSNFWRWNE